MTQGQQKISGRMSFDEFVRFKLHALYRSYGYERYKMDKFEEYELYLRNRDFIRTDSVITFQDRNGRLLALKPDLTLSIVKNFRYEPGRIQRVFYSENVYRTTLSQTHREMPQTGLECLGAIGRQELKEVTLLAAESLAQIADSFVLQISHMGILSDLTKNIEDVSLRNELIRLIGEKNGHDLRKTAREGGVPEDITDAMASLVSAHGGPDETLEAVAALPLGEEGKAAIEELRDVFGLLESRGFGPSVRADFSVVHELSYYSGIVFSGFAEGVPVSVLSGGQYDGLMTRNGKKGGALGFAVSLDAFLRMGEGVKDVDVVLTTKGGRE